MYFYKFNLQTGVIEEKSTSPFIGENLAKSDENYDMENYTYVIGQLLDGTITAITKQAKPLEYFIRNLKERDSKIEELQEKVALQQETIDQLLLDSLGGM